ncbi:MAG: flagellin, partial [Selenomonadaceae bacterium]|nr:flagellin [Selenomonadaceae bacterium]
MAMTVMHNAGAQLSLGELNRNINKAGKALAKVSSGMKINSAQDDASAYSISERMRGQIRALLQDNQNVQNGSSMVRTAERGIDQIIQNIRTLKEKAIDAANDSNTDEDRATIQKEFGQLVNTIDDIAIGTQFNGKRLLDGTYSGGQKKHHFKRQKRR